MSQVSELDDARGEDADSLLGNLMLIAALILAFAVSLMNQTFKNDELLEAEYRYQRFKQLQMKCGGDESCLAEDEIWKGGQGGNCHLIYRIRDGYFCVAMCVAALIIGAVCGLSLGFGGTRSDPKRFHTWYALFGG